MPDNNNKVSAYEQRASYSADMANKLAGINNRGPDGVGLVPQTPAPAPTVITAAQLATKERATIGIPLGPVPVGGVPSGLFFLRGGGGS